jgi:hypothetical protein
LPISKGRDVRRKKTVCLDPWKRKIAIRKKKSRIRMAYIKPKVDSAASNSFDSIKRKKEEVEAEEKQKNCKIASRGDFNGGKSGKSVP